jgi:uncharacterized protein
LSKIWTQTLKGTAIDLIDVDPKAVDFREICEQLATTILHHPGASIQPISAAFHTLIALDCCEDAIKPWVALHRFHEARLGNIAEATKAALAHHAGELGGQFSSAVGYAFEALARSHDAAIHAAAGLPMPTLAQCQKILVADLCAITSERRDFMAPPPKRWSHAIENSRASTRVYRAKTFGKCAFDVGEELYRRLEGLLPVLATAGKRGAAA